MTRLVLDPQGFWRTLTESPAESAWGALGAAWRQGKATLCLSPALVALYMDVAQGEAAQALGIDETLLGKIGWLLRQQGDWYRSDAVADALGAPWDVLLAVAAIARPDALVTAAEPPAWPHAPKVPVLREPPAR